jgi:hypothetical protein
MTWLYYVDILAGKNGKVNTPIPAPSNKLLHPFQIADHFGFLITHTYTYLYLCAYSKSYTLKDQKRPIIWGEAKQKLARISMAQVTPSSYCTVHAVHVDSQLLTSANQHLVPGIPMPIRRYIYASKARDLVHMHAQQVASCAPCPCCICMPRAVTATRPTRTLAPSRASHEKQQLPVYDCLWPEGARGRRRPCLACVPGPPTNPRLKHAYHQISNQLN